MKITQKQILDNMYISDITLTKYGIDQNYNSSVIDFMVDCKDHKQFVIDVIFTCNLIPEEYAKKFSKWCIENVIHLTTNKKLLDYFHNIDNLLDVESDLKNIQLNSNDQKQPILSSAISSYLKGQFHSCIRSCATLCSISNGRFNYLLPHHQWFTEDEAIDSQYNKLMQIFQHIEIGSPLDFQVIDYVGDNFANLELDFDNGDSLFLAAQESYYVLEKKSLIRKGFNFDIKAEEWGQNTIHDFADMFFVIKGNKKDRVNRTFKHSDGQEFTIEYLTKGEVILCTYDMNMAVSLIQKYCPLDKKNTICYQTLLKSNNSSIESGICNTVIQGKNSFAKIGYKSILIQDTDSIAIEKDWHSIVIQESNCFVYQGVRSTLIVDTMHDNYVKTNQRSRILINYYEVGKVLNCGVDFEAGDILHIHMDRITKITKDQLPKWIIQKLESENVEI